MSPDDILDEYLDDERNMDVDNNDLVPTNIPPDPAAAAVDMETYQV